MTRLYLVDDDNSYLDALEKFVLLSSELQIAGSYSDLESDENVEEMIENIKLINPDIILMDISFAPVKRPDDFGIELTSRIKAAYPEQKIIMLAKDLDDDAKQYNIIKRSFRAGAIAYLSKSELEKWNEGIKETMNGHMFISPGLQEILLKGFKIAQTYGLSIREVQAIRSLSLDKRIKEVGEDMGIGFDGANFHIRNAKVKLDLKTNQGMVAKALREGIID